MKKILNSALDHILAFFLPDNYYFFRKGFCPCCDREVIFRSKNHWLRDSFLCNYCLSIPRERALMLTIEKYCPNWKALNIHESSPSDKGASIKLKKFCSNYIESQYYPDREFGIIIDGFRNEDLEHQTFEDEKFDLVITQDVFEHVYDPAKAFREIARTLKKGGMHIFTVPLVNKFNSTVKWAIKGADGEPEFLQEPEYHQNPVDPKGSPVTMHWGYDIVDFIKECSELETKVEYLDDLNFGVRAEFIEVLISTKKLCQTLE